MASAQLAIANASLLAALLKPDVEADRPACSRDEIEQLHGLLSAAVARCSPANVQKCKQWLLQHLAQSRVRTAALAKYLVAYANSLSTQQQRQQQQPEGAKKGTHPSTKRRRLHILYILNDVLFHVKFRIHDEVFLNQVEPHLSALFKSAASFENAPKHEKKLKDLIHIWQQKSYFSDSVLDKLRTAVAEGPKNKDPGSNGADIAKKATAASSAREAPFLLPSMHGDASTPWYDLPAANWLPVIEPNSTRPMNPSMIKPLHLAGGPADKTLVAAVKKLMGDVDKIYGKDVRLNGDPSVDISQMGELIERDELGDIVGGETYYGWSRAFCEKMKARRRGDAMDIDDDRRGRRGSSRSSSRSRGRSRDRSSSQGSSGPAIKRRRVSDSRSRSRSQDRSRSRSRRDRSWTSKSPSRSRRRSYSRQSRSLSRSRSPRRHQNGQDHRSRSRDSYSPSQALGASYGGVPSNNGPPNNFLPPNLSQQQQQQQHQQQHQQQFNQGPPNFPGAPNFIPPPPQHLSAQVGFDAWNVPPPPPPPPHFQGHWPPPPPPPPGMPVVGGGIGIPQPTHQGWFPPNAGSPPVPGPSPGPWSGGWAPPPPPPPPTGPPQQGGGGGYGYGGRGGNGGYRGRGGNYGRGRGW